MLSVLYIYTVPLFHFLYPFFKLKNIRLKIVPLDTGPIDEGQTSFFLLLFVFFALNILPADQAVRQKFIMAQPAASLVLLLKFVTAVVCRNTEIYFKNQILSRNIWKGIST